MTEKGAKDYVAAVFWSVLVNISKMLPVGVLAAALSGIVEALTNGTDPRAGLTRFLAAGVLALAALFVTFLIQYKALYEATYRESANRRIRLAEVLRQLPLSFFGNRDLTDLTTTIMGDTETLEKAFSHFYPAMHGALISTALISAGMLLYDWRMALALLWVVPASLLMVHLSRRMEKRHIKKGLVTRRAATDAMQEALECAPEIKACNQKTRYIADLNRRLDEAEQDTIRGELFTGSVVTAAQSFLKLGIATTVLTGVLLMSRGDLALIPFLMFLIAATRVYDPIGSMFANMAAVFACEVRIERMQEIESEKRMTGLTEYDPDGYDIRFEHVTFAYREKRGRAKRRFLYGEAGTGDGAGGALRRRQVHGSQAGGPLLGPGGGNDAAGRRGCVHGGRRGTAEELRHRISGCGAVCGYRDGKHPPRQAGRHRRGGAGGGEGGAVRHLCIQAAGRLPYPDRGKRLPALRRRAAAHLHCPRHLEGRAGDFAG